MADRELTFHFEDVRSEGSRIGPTYYVGGDYTPSAVRIYAEKVPTDGDFEVDILASDVTIFDDRAEVLTPSMADSATLTHTARTTALLPKGQDSDVMSGDFKKDAHISNEFVHCILKALKGAKNVTVQLELEQDIESELGDSKEE